MRLKKVVIILKVNIRSEMKELEDFLNKLSKEYGILAIMRGVFWWLAEQLEKLKEKE